MEKFKYSNPGWMFFIDGSGKTEFKIGTKYVTDLEKYLAEGNEIEPQFTAEELSAKEAEKEAQAILSQKQTCLRLLNETDKRMVSDWPYPEDRAKNEEYRSKLRVCMASAVLMDIPVDPFANPKASI